MLLVISLSCDLEFKFTLSEIRKQRAERIKRPAMQDPSSPVPPSCSKF